MLILQTMWGERALTVRRKEGRVGEEENGEGGEEDRGEDRRGE